MQDIATMSGPLQGPPRAPSWRAWAAQTLVSVGGQLIGWGWRLAPSKSGRGAPPVLEFCADSSAGGGRLYRDGRLVGTLHGVHRL